jgi:hypothetical protein
MMEEHRERHMEMHEKAAILARELGVHAQGSIRAILHFLKEQNADLLVLGLHQHDFYLSHLWSSVYDLAQDASIGALTGSHAVFCRERATVDNRLDHVANSHP